MERKPPPYNPRDPAPDVLAGQKPTPVQDDAPADPVPHDMAHAIAAAVAEAVASTLARMNYSSAQPEQPAPAAEQPSIANPEPLPPPQAAPEPANHPADPPPPAADTAVPEQGPADHPRPTAEPMAFNREPLAEPKPEADQSDSAQQLADAILDALARWEDGRRQDEPDRPAELATAFTTDDLPPQAPPTSPPSPSAPEPGPGTDQASTPPDMRPSPDTEDALLRLVSDIREELRLLPDRIGEAITVALGEGS